MRILIKGVLLDGVKKDIYIDGNTIRKIGDGLVVDADKVIHGDGKAAIPSMMNSHTHAAMTLLRGYADDMELDRWLKEKIWPIEERMKEEDVYWGTKLACLEMIKTGTTFFNDMYWHWHGTARAVEEMGLRVFASGVLIDLFDSDRAKKEIAINERLFEESQNYSKRITFSLGPHAIYTVSEGSLKWAKSFAERHSLFIHIHLCETEKEVRDCIRERGLRPVRYLEKIGLLSPNLIAAHCNWLDDEDPKILGEYGVKVVMNPTSNMKLASGGISHYHRLKEYGVVCCLGTDGVCSNNNLDMFEAMKIASLFGKFTSGDPTHLPAEETLCMATKNPAIAFGIDCGIIEEGRLADIALVDLGGPEFFPGHNLLSDLVYAANGSCVDTLICDGRILMENRRVRDEEEILKMARKVAHRLVK